MEVQISDNGKEIYAPLKKKWLVLTPEEKVRQEYIKRLVDNYGYSYEQMGQEVPVAEGNERGTGGARADIIVWDSPDKVLKEAPVIVVECKAEYINTKVSQVMAQLHNLT